MKRSYLDLNVWQRSRRLIRKIYEVTKDFPKDEIFGLTNQMRRAAVSVPSNIAEGCGRHHVNDSVQLFFIARGSLYELETQVYIAFDQKCLQEQVTHAIVEEITACKRMLNGFINYYKSLKLSNNE